MLTHCNAGALATGGIGTALAPIYLAHEAGRRVHVFVDETRPVLQGARLTAWELDRLGIPHRLVADLMAASLMAGGEVDCVIVGADRIAANGDVANKVGTYGLAVLAHHHGIPFYVAAPVSTIDLACPDGAAIPVEHIAAKPGEMPAVIVDISRARAMGYRPTHDLKSGIATVWPEFAPAGGAPAPGTGAQAPDGKAAP